MMNWEKISFNNMVDFYEPELIQIINGKNPKELFAKNFTNQLIKRKILKIDHTKGRKKLILTDNVKIILKNSSTPITTIPNPKTIPT